MELIYKKAEYEDIAGLKNVWETVFGDSRQYINFFFENAYKPGMAYVYKAENEVVGMLYLIPVFADGPTQKTIKGGYIYAVATLPKWRGHQIATRLLHFTNADAQANLGYDFTMLKPAEPSLFAYYAKRGYGEYFKNKTITAKLEQPTQAQSIITDVLAEAAPSMLTKLYKIRYKAFENLAAQAYYSEEFFYYAIEEHFYKGGRIACLKNNGYALLLPDAAAKTVYVTELAAQTLNEKTVEEFLAAFAHFYPGWHAVLTLPCFGGAPQNSAITQGAMLLPLSQKGQEFFESTVHCGQAAPYFALALD